MCGFFHGSGVLTVRVHGQDIAGQSPKLAHLHSLRYFNLFHCAFHIIVFAILIAVALGGDCGGRVGAPVDICKNPYRLSITINFDDQ